MSCHVCPCSFSLFTHLIRRQNHRSPGRNRLRKTGPGGATDPTSPAAPGAGDRWRVASVAVADGDPRRREAGGAPVGFREQPNSTISTVSLMVDGPNSWHMAHGGMYYHCVCQGFPVSSRADRSTGRWFFHWSTLMHRSCWSMGWLKPQGSSFIYGQRDLLERWGSAFNKVRGSVFFKGKLLISLDLSCFFAFFFP